MNPDYIIIGAGSSGSVIANRLSANPENQVLLLEAGKRPNFYSKIPGLYSLVHKSKMNWGFRTAPQVHVENRKIFIPRGRSLGGSSATNAMAYVRGNALDFDEWAAEGNKGWDYQSVLPYFKKSENHLSLKGKFHHQGGELQVGFAPQYFPMTDNFITACKNQGIPFNKDYNGTTQEGASYLQYTINRRKRQSTYEDFLKPINTRKNLMIRTGAMVKKIIVKNQKAIGVEVYTGKNTWETLACSKEIILCAGAIQSPQILKVSGIGPKQELKALHIDLVKELHGVGENLHDHVWSGTSDYSKLTGVNATLKKGIFLREMFKYWFAKKSLMDNSVIEGNAFYKSSPEERKPDMQFHFAPLQLGMAYGYDLYDISSIPTENGYSIMDILIQPKSRGNIRITAADTRVAPLIQPNFLAVKSDLKKLIIGLKKAMAVMDDPAFDSVRKSPMNFPSRKSSDEALANHIRKTLETLYHPVGTCKMGTDEQSVVNAQLRVHGIANLRIADASIMPTVTSGNTNAACIMIGEKAADLIANPA